MTSLNPIEAPVDFVILAGLPSPGIAEVLGAGSPRKWDERKGYALSGASLVFKGNGLAKFTLQLRLYTIEHWEAWEAWKPLVMRPPVGERARALDIYHPFLDSLEIRSVVVEDVLQPQQTDDGEWTIEIKLIEYRRPVVALARQDGSRNRSTDPVDQYIDALSSQVQELASE